MVLLPKKIQPWKILLMCSMIGVGVVLLSFSNTWEVSLLPRILSSAGSFRADDDNTFSFLSMYLHNNLKEPADTTRNQVDWVNYQRVLQFRRLLVKMTAVETGDEWPTVVDNETSLLPPDIVSDFRFKRFVNRYIISRQACEFTSQELKGTISKDQTEVLIIDDKHHLSVCLNAKAATTSFILYAKVLGVYNVMNNLLFQLKKKFPRSELTENIKLSNIEGVRRTFSTRNLKTVLVRHPFQRVLSTYVNKIYFNNIYSKGESELFTAMMTFSRISPEKAREIILNEGSNKVPVNYVKKLPCYDSPASPDVSLNYSTTLNKHGQEIPSFRGFVLGVLFTMLPCRGNLQCLRTENRHTKTQVARCGPCLTRYDLVMKVETLREDIEFVEELLGIDSAWQFQQDVMAVNQKIAAEKETEGMRTVNSESGDLMANSHEKVFTYNEYMSQLAPLEKDMLYTVYFNDFNVFGYDPCEGL